MTAVVVLSANEVESLIAMAVDRAVDKVLAGRQHPETWLPVGVVAARLAKSDKTIRNWIREGRFTRVSGGEGSPYLVSSLEVDALSCAANSSPDAS